MSVLLFTKRLYVPIDLFVLFRLNVSFAYKLIRGCLIITPDFVNVVASLR